MYIYIKMLFWNRFAHAVKVRARLRQSIKQEKMPPYTQANATLKTVNIDVRDGPIWFVMGGGG
jgi:hypothetical protein